MTSILNDFGRVAEALVKQHAPAHSIKAPDGRMPTKQTSGRNGALKKLTSLLTTRKMRMQRNHGDELYAWYTDDAQDPWVTTWECHDEDWRMDSMVW